MITKKSFIYGLLAIFLMILLVSFGSAKAAERPIKIGYTAPFTGFLAGVGGDMRDVWLLYLDQIGQQGGRKRDSVNP